MTNTTTDLELFTAGFELAFIIWWGIIVLRNTFKRNIP